MLEWAAKELAVSRRNLELQFGDIQDWAQREAMERRIDDSLLKCLGLDKPPKQRVRHTVWRKQLTDSTRQLKLGADRAIKAEDRVGDAGWHGVVQCGGSGCSKVSGWGSKP